MKHLLHIAIVAAIIVGAMSACSDESCYDNGSALPLATLCVGGSQQTIGGLSVMGIGVPGDSLLADSTSIKEIFLPLRAGATTTSYALWRTVFFDTVKVVVRDTLTLDYTPIEYFHSAECGAMFNFDLRHVQHTRHGIDTVVVLTPLVTNARTPALSIPFTDFSQ